METSPNSREWEVRFDERFIPNDRDIPTYIENGNDLKDFIHQELQKARDSWLRELKDLHTKWDGMADIALMREIEEMIEPVDCYGRTIDTSFIKTPPAQSELDQPDALTK